MRNVITVDPRHDERWLRLVSDRAGTDVFHSPGWMRVLADTYDFQPTATILMQDDAPVAGIPSVDIESLGTRRRKSLPFSDFCDPLVDDGETWRLLSDFLLDDGMSLTLRCRAATWPRLDERFHRVSEVRWHRVDLSRSEQEIWDSLHPSARRAIRRAGNMGVEVHPAEGTADLRAFFLMHLDVRKHKYGLLAQPFAFFEHIWEQFLGPGRGELLLARHEGDIVGGVLFLDWRDTTYYKFNASDPANLDLRPNDLILWTGIRRGLDRGLSWLDFGVSDLDQPGLIRFKEKYATEEGGVDTLVAARNGEPSSRVEEDMRGLLSHLTALLVNDDVPTSLTERAGELFYRYFA